MFRGLSLGLEFRTLYLRARQVLIVPSEPNASVKGQGHLILLRIAA